MADKWVGVDSLYPELTNFTQEEKQQAMVWISSNPVIVSTLTQHTRPMQIPSLRFSLDLHLRNSTYTPVPQILTLKKPIEFATLLFLVARELNLNRPAPPSAASLTKPNDDDMS